MRLVFLGTGDAWASGGSANSALLVEHAGARLLVDCGPTVPCALAERGLGAGDLGGILVTHAHGDHTGGLPFLVLAADAAGFRGPLDVVGPPGLAGQVEALTRALYPDSHSSPDLARYREVAAGDRLALAGLAVEARRVHHMDPPWVSLAYRLTAGDRTVAFTGDAGPRTDFESLAAGADVLVAECALAQSPPGRPDRGHTSVDDVGERLVRAGARRLVLTHLSVEARVRARAIPGVTVAADGLELEV